MTRPLFQLRTHKDTSRQPRNRGWLICGGLCYTDTPSAFFQAIIVRLVLWQAAIGELGSDSGSGVSSYGMPETMPVYVRDKDRHGIVIDRDRVLGD